MARNKWNLEKFIERANIIHDKTMDRENSLRKSGYNVISIWESEFNEK